MTQGTVSKKLGLTPAKSKGMEVAPTRIAELNSLLPGGYVYGKMNLVFGAPSSGKTTHIVETIADEMKKDKKMQFVLIPSERSEDLDYYKNNLGLPLDRTHLHMPEQFIFEEVMEKVEDILKVSHEHNIKAILIDSWDGLLANKQIYDTQGNRKKATKETVGAKAKAASDKFPLIKGLIADKKILFMVICQIRTGGIGGYTTFKTFAGGNALEHYSDIIVFQDIAGMIKKTINNREQVIGHETKFVLKKSKVNNNTHKGIQIPYYYDESWDNFLGTWIEAQHTGVVVKHGGGWFECSLFPPAGSKMQPRIRGEDNARAFFKDPDQVKAIQDLIDKVKSNTVSEDIIVEDEDY